jgi:hypothetical protein
MGVLHYASAIVPGATYITNAGIAATIIISALVIIVCLLLAFSPPVQGGK